MGRPCGTGIALNYGIHEPVRDIGLAEHVCELRRILSEMKLNETWSIILSLVDLFSQRISTVFSKAKTQNVILLSRTHLGLLGSFTYAAVSPRIPKGLHRSGIPI